MVMKKSLVAVAAVVAGSAALAQSSVTVFGVVDVGLQRGTGSIASRTQVSSGAMNASRIGFNGTEDLGGGLAATFWLEAGINTDSGVGGTTNTNNQNSGGAAALAGSQGLTFNRKSTVGLSGPWGEVRLGRDYTPQYGIQFTYDPLGNNGVGATQSVSSSIIGPTQFRASNAVTYATPSLGGFTAIVQHYRGENASNAADSGDGTGSGIRVTYNAPTWSVSAATGKVEQVTGDVRQSNLGAQVGLGKVKVMAYATRDRNALLRAKGYLVGGLWAVGVGEVRLAYSTYETNATPANPKIGKLAVGYVHNLSKRTALYATAAFVNNSGGAAFAPGGGITGANQSSRGYDVGLRHSF